MPARAGALRPLPFLDGFAVGGGEPDEAVGEEEEFARARVLGAFELEESAAPEERASRRDKLEWEVGGGALEGKKGKGLCVSVEGGVECVCN